MVVTDAFIYIHMPKTGGTFVTEALTRLHELPQRRRRSRLRRAAAWVLPGLRRRSGGSPPRYGPLLNIEPKHGTCRDVPEHLRHKPLLSTVRNPYDWYVSQYEFAWWTRTFEYHPEPHPTPVGAAIEQALPEFESVHPEFPEIAFEAFVELCDRAALLYDGKTGKSLGLLTHGFLRYYYRNVEAVLSRLDGEYIRSGRHRTEMFDLEFLRTHHLNRDLYDALVARGYSREDVAFIHGLEKVLPMGRGRGDHQVWQDYYTPALKEHIRQREWVLFEIFPEFDV